MFLLLTMLVCVVGVRAELEKVETGGSRNCSRDSRNSHRIAEKIHSEPSLGITSLRNRRLLNNKLILSMI